MMGRVKGDLRRFGIYIGRMLSDLSHACSRKIELKNAVEISDGCDLMVVLDALLKAMTTGGLQG